MTKQVFRWILIAVVLFFVIVAWGITRLSEGIWRVVRGPGKKDETWGIRK